MGGRERGREGGREGERAKERLTYLYFNNGNRFQ